MSKICGTCGAACEDNANACSNCGAPFAAEKKNKLTDICAKIPGLNKLQPKIQMLIAKIVIIAVPVLAVLGIILIIVAAVALNSTPKAALEKYFDSIADRDVKANIAVMPEYYKEQYNNLEDSTIEDEVEQDLKDELEEYEEEYGHNIKFKLKVVDKEEITNNELKEIKERYEFKNLDVDKIKKGVEIDFEITVKGKDGEDEADGTAVLIKEDGKWKVYKVHFDFD